MAREINAKFVIALGVVLCGIAGVASVVVIKKLQGRNPEVLKQQGEDALAHGNIEQAAFYFSRAGEALAAKQMPDADVMHGRAGDLFKKASEKAGTSVEARGFYSAAMQQWQLGMLANPRNREVAEKYLDETYKQATVDQSARMWTALLQQSKRYIENVIEREKTKTAPAKPYVYRAQSQLQLQLLSKITDIAPKILDDIDADADKAIELEQDLSPKVFSGKAIAIKAERKWLYAMTREASGQSDEADKQRGEAMEMLQDYLKSNPKDIDVISALINRLSQWSRAKEMIIRQRQAEALKWPADQARLLKDVPKLKEEAPKLRQQAVQIARTAYESDKEDGQMLTMLITALGEENAEESKTLLKEYLVVKPKDAQGWYRLADLNQETDKPRDAIECYRTAMANAKEGGGFEAVKNERVETGCVYSLASLYLDQADREGPETAEGKPDLAAALEYTDRFRKMNPNPAYLDLLDGRAQLLRGNVPEAMRLLRRAEPALTEEGRSPGALSVKLNLARAHEQQRQYGPAISYLTDVLNMTNRPGNIGILLTWVRMHVELGRYDDAIAALEGLRKENVTMSDALKGRAEALELEALRRRGDQMDPSVKERLAKSVPAMVQLAYDDLLAGDVGDAVSETEKKRRRATMALEDLKPILEDPKEQGNPQVLQIAAMAHMGLDQKEKASVLVERLLKDHPDDRAAQFLKLQIEKPDANPSDLMKQVIEASTDPYMKQIMLSRWYAMSQQPEKSLEAMQAADAAVDEKSPEARLAHADLTERMFLGAGMLAVSAKDEATRKKYWTLAETYMQRAERLNLDGVNGVLYSGRMDLIKSAAQGLAPAEREALQRSGAQKVEKAVTQRPDYAVARTLLGQVYFDQGQQFLQSQRTDLADQRFEAAGEQFRQSLRLKPNDLTAIRCMIFILDRKNDRISRTEAVSWLNEGLKLAPRDPALLSFSDMLEDPAKVMVNREAILKSDPGNVDNIRRLASLYVRAHTPEKAVAMVKVLYDGHKDDLMIADLMARTYGDNKKFSEGVKLYDPFIQSTDPKVKYRANMLMGEMCQINKEMDKAELAFKSAMEVESSGSDEAHRRLADLYFERSDWEAAATEYRSLYEKTAPGEVRSRVVRRLVEAEIRQNLLPSAIKLLEDEVLRAQPDDPEGLVLRAYARIQLANQVRKASDRDAARASALADLNRVLQKIPDYPDALYYRALLTIQSHGEIKPASDDLMRVRERDRTAVNARILLAQTFRIRRLYLDAANEYAEVVVSRPETVELRRIYADFLLELEDQGIKQGLFDPARQDDLAKAFQAIKVEDRLMQLIHETLPEYPIEAHATYANLLAIRGSLDEARKEYKDLKESVHAQYLELRNNPPVAPTPSAEKAYKQLLKTVLGADIGISLSYMQTLLEAQNYEDVIAMATDLISAQDTIELRLYRAEAYMKSNKPTEARTDVASAFAMASKKQGVYLVIVDRALERQVLPPDVVAAILQDRYSREGADVQSGAMLAYVLMRSGHNAEALKVVDSLKPPPAESEETWTIREDVLRVSGNTRLGAKKYDDAMKDYLELLKTSPEDSETLNNVAYLLAERGWKLMEDSTGSPNEMRKRTDEARRIGVEARSYAERAVGLLLNSSNVKQSLQGSAGLYDTLGWCQLLAGNQDSALISLRQSLSLDPQPLTYFHLAKANIAIGRVEDARKLIRDGIRRAEQMKDPSLEQLQKLEKELP